MFLRATLLLATLVFANPAALAAPECPRSIIPPKAPQNVVDWYDKYVAPSRTLAGTPENPRPTKSQVEAFIDSIKAFHRRAVSDSLFFEPLVQQIMAKYSDAGDFRDLSSVTAKKIYRPGSGPDLDFSAMCIDILRSRFPEDTFAITLSGVSIDNCQHVTVRGLVFTNTLVNGAMNPATSVLVASHPRAVRRTVFAAPMLLATSSTTAAR